MSQLANITQATDKTFFFEVNLKGLKIVIITFL